MPPDEGYFNKPPSDCIECCRDRPPCLSDVLFCKGQPQGTGRAQSNFPKREVRRPYRTLPQAAPDTE